MTDDLRDALLDLPRDIERSVVAPDLAARAWTAGRRRRAVRTLATAAAALALLLAGWAVAPQLRPAPLQPADHRSGGPVVDGYPQRLALPWLDLGLSTAPGPTAGLAQVNAAGDNRWRLVAPDGRMSRLPANGDDVIPALSDDGRRLSYFEGGITGHLVVRDLVTGARWDVAGVGDAAISPKVRSPYFAGMQEPSFWSPGGQRLLLSGALRREGVFGGLLLDPTRRTVRFLTMPAKVFHAVGWMGEDRIVWSTARPDLVVTDLDGRVRRRVRLDLAGLPPIATHQWTVSVSPDGRVAQLRSDDVADNVVATFSTATGRRLGAHLVQRISDVCPTGWRGRRVVVPALDDTTSVRLVELEPRAGAVDLGYPTRTLTVSDPGDSIVCLWLSPRALAGRAHGWPWGTSTSWLSWHARDLVAGAVLTLLVLGLALVLRRRRPIR